MHTNLRQLTASAHNLQGPHKSIIHITLHLTLHQEFLMWSKWKLQEPQSKTKTK